MNRIVRPSRGLIPMRALVLAPFVAAGLEVGSPTREMHVISSVLLATGFILLLRLVTLEIRQQGRFARSVLILGTSSMASKLIEEIEGANDARYVVAGVVAEKPPKCEAGNARWLGPPDRLAEIVMRVRPACIVVAIVNWRKHLPLRSLLDSRVRGIVVEDAVEFYEHLTGKIAIEALTPSMLIFSKGFRNHVTAQATARVVSVVLAALGLVLFGPLLAAIAVAIKLDSRGPVLFVQDRVGKDGRSFELLKLRTMHPSDGPRSEWVQDNTDRITRLGRWLRRFRLDELPQLVNVLRGDMNLVGPRPHPTSNQKVFIEQIAYYRLRSTIRPGVTGWAQVRYGYANNLDEEREKMRYDLYYVKNRSFWLDVRILLKTVAIMLVGRGATKVCSRTPLRRGSTWPSARSDSARGGYWPWPVASHAARHSAGRQ